MRGNTALTNSKQKGKRGELEVAKMLQLIGYDARRSVQYCGSSGDAADVVGVGGLHLEVKRTETISIRKWMEQAERDAEKSGRTPVVVFRSNGKRWRVCLDAEAFFTMYKEVLENGYQTEGADDAGASETISGD